MGATFHAQREKPRTYGFNSRTRVGATRFDYATGKVVLVSIHAPVWVRRFCLLFRHSVAGFQFTHPCGCDANAVEVLHCLAKFQFTHPCGCDGCRRVHHRVALRFQFTHPCGCDPIWIASSTSALVSIHAPVWVRLLCPVRIGRIPGFNSRTRVGATTDDGNGNGLVIVSIHAPVWVRPRVDGNLIHALSFNSRTRVGATIGREARSVHGNVSIHAPVWVRPRAVCHCGPRAEFQFTHPCGCDGQATPGCIRKYCFNSRTRVGATPGSASKTAL